jgi:hypothetical protein
MFLEKKIEIFRVHVFISWEGKNLLKNCINLPNECSAWGILNVFHTHLFMRIARVEGQWGRRDEARFLM